MLDSFNILLALGICQITPMETQNRIITRQKYQHVPGVLVYMDLEERSDRCVSVVRLTVDSVVNSNGMLTTLHVKDLRTVTRLIRIRYL